MANLPSRYKEPLILLPGLLTPLIPRAGQEHAFTALRDLEQRKVDTEEFPLDTTGALDGQILVYSSSTTRWEKRRWVPYLGIGDQEDSSYALTVSPSGSQFGIRIIRPLDGTLPLFQAQSETGVPYVTISTSGLFAINQDPIHRQLFAVSGGITRIYYTDATNPRSGLRGLHIDKSASGDLTSHGISYDLGGIPKYESGIDYQTLAGSGNADFVLVFCHMTNGASGSDLFRLCPPGASVFGVCQWDLAGDKVGTPATSPSLLRLRPQAYGLSCLNLFASGAAVILAVLDQTSTLYNVPQTALAAGYSMLSNQNNRGIQLQQILDASQVRNFVMLRGGLGSSGVCTAAVPTFTAPFGASFGLESTDTTISLCTAAAGTDVAVIRGLTMSNTGAIAVSGSLAAGSTLQVWGAANFLNTVTTSGQLTAAGALQVWGKATFQNDQVTSGALSVVGTSQLWGAVTALGTVTASGQITGASRLQVWGAVNLLNNLAVSGALAVGGTLLVLGAAVTQRIDATAAGFSSSVGGGSTKGFQWNTYQHTFTSDADYTLTGTQLNAVYLDIQTDAVLTTTRSIIVPLAIGTEWTIRNRNTQSIQIIGSSGTGTTVASGRMAKLICSGSNVIRVSPDTVP